jgi:hypothetical protein
MEQNTGTVTSMLEDNCWGDANRNKKQTGRRVYRLLIEFNIGPPCKGKMCFAEHQLLDHRVQKTRFGDKG